jgi:hypothetical protein
MDRKVKKIVEKLEGDGRLTNSAGQQIATPRYWMVVWQAFQLLPRGEKLAGKDLHITLRAPNLNSLSGALTPDSGLTLQLEDGTRVDGFLAGTRFVPSSGRRES